MKKIKRDAVPWHVSKSKWCFKSEMTSKPSSLNGYWEYRRVSHSNNNICVEFKATSTHNKKEGKRNPEVEKMWKRLWDEKNVKK